MVDRHFVTTWSVLLGAATRSLLLFSSLKHPHYQKICIFEISKCKPVFCRKNECCVRYIYDFDLWQTVYSEVFSTTFLGSNIFFKGTSSVSSKLLHSSYKPKLHAQKTEICWVFFVCFFICFVFGGRKITVSIVFFFQEPIKTDWKVAVNYLYLKCVFWSKYSW